MLWIILAWLSCGVAYIFLGLLKKRLRNPANPFWDKWVLSSTRDALIAGPFILVIGIIWFISEIPTFQSKKTWVLKKFESDE
jgi:hypothetical protein